MHGHPALPRLFPNDLPGEGRRSAERRIQPCPRRAIRCCHLSVPRPKTILALCGERDPLAIHLSAADPSLGNGDAHERIGIYRIGILFKDRQISKFARL